MFLVCWLGEGILNWPRMKILICLLLTRCHFVVLKRSFCNNFSMCWVLDMFWQGVGGTLDPPPIPWTPSAPPSAAQAKPWVRSIESHFTQPLSLPLYPTPAGGAEANGGRQAHAPP